MRPLAVIACSLALAVPLVSFAPPAKADLLGQAQRFFDNGRGHDRGAYERGRQDEWRRQHAERDWGYQRRDPYRNWSRAEPRYQQGYSQDRYNGGGEAR